jgi:GAF domain-containing protein
VSDLPLNESLAALARFIVGDGTFEDTLQRVTDLTVYAIQGAEFAGLTMITEGRKHTAVFTDELAPEVDRTQYESGEGPCIEAFETGKVQTIESTLEEGPWPEFRQAATEHGIHSTLSLPMMVDRKTVGAMNLYSRQERAFSERDHEFGLLFASQAAIVLANTQAYCDAHQLTLRLSEAMSSRSVIEQAKGMLMAAQGCGEDAAFELLVQASQRENLKLRDIAQRIVDEAVARGRQSKPGPRPPSAG